MASRGSFTVWQWNCRGFHHKKAPLMQLIKTSPDKPKVIMLQETLADEISLSGYKATCRGKEPGRGLATLVDKKIPFIEHDLRLGLNKLEYLLVEIILKRNRGKPQSLFCLNVYSSPSDMKQSFRALLNKTMAVTKHAPLIIGGDFNAPHQTWGYRWNTKKGDGLWHLATDLNLSLITDPAYPTRCGTSTCRDSTPDLTFVSNLANAGWNNSNIDLGSDHYILQIVLETPSNEIKHFNYIDWDLFRKARKSRAETETGQKKTLQTWTTQLREDVKAATKAITTEEDIEIMDSRLAHLIEAKQSMLKRWKTQRLNRRLRKRIALLNREIEEHARYLQQQQWDELCNTIDGRIKRGGNWNLL